jgi:hypothetical protein
VVKTNQTIAGARMAISMNMVPEKRSKNASATLLVPWRAFFFAVMGCSGLARTGIAPI